MIVLVKMAMIIIIIFNVFEIKINQPSMLTLAAVAFAAVIVNGLSHVDEITNSSTNSSSTTTSLNRTGSKPTDSIYLKSPNA